MQRKIKTKKPTFGQCNTFFSTRRGNEKMIFGNFKIEFYTVIILYFMSYHFEHLTLMRIWSFLVLLVITMDIIVYLVNKKNDHR